jgi:AAA15 family ATPase/GTPase
LRIKSFAIDGLMGRSNPLAFDLSPDLAVLTGRNGAGKTSVLKLLWSVISGNILVGLTEVPFSRLNVVTDSYACTVYRLGRRTCKIEIEVNNQIKLYEDQHDGDGDVIENAEDDANTLLRSLGSSFFFPTFRRIEGGFTILPTRLGNGLTRQFKGRTELDEALANLSRALSHDPHVFVSTLATVDIVNLLLKKYTDLSEEANLLQARISRQVIDTIRGFGSEDREVKNFEEATSLLGDVRYAIERMEVDRETIMKPMGAIQELVTKLIGHTGIKFGSKISFGDAATAVNSDVLSAGEKQMLSFVCYNAFNADTIFFIDEPELSLHVDWQRGLFPTLSSQGTTNQFIVATHSPFIYSKYPDKEIEIISDRGDMVRGEA